MSKDEQVIEIKECIDSVYGADCAYFGVDGFAIANEIYDAGYCKRSEWISVDERLPDEDVRVLVYINSERSYTKFDTDRLKDGRWVRWSLDVTHWMELPEAPKMEGENI